MKFFWRAVTMKYPRCIVVCILLASLIATAKEDPSQDSSGDEHNSGKTAIMIYRKVFKQKRAQQMSAAGDLMKLKDYAKTYKMVEVLLDKLFKVLRDAKVKLMESGYIPGGDFPKERQQLEALANVLENTAFFGDILLRLPDITHKVYKRSKEWELLAKWSISFCNETQVYDEMDTMLLNLMAQELELVPQDPNYINPFKLQEQLMQQAKEQASSQKESSKKKKKDKTKKKRGPHLSGHTEF